MRLDSVKHGLRYTPEYKTWAAMVSRCRNKKKKYYGRRGIRVYKRWKDPVLFIKDMGPKPKDHSLDRIDGDSDYTPDNCRWATWKEQRANRKNHNHRKTITIPWRYTIQKKEVKIRRRCKCGCDSITNEGSQYIWGHNRKGKRKCYLSF